MTRTPPPSSTPRRRLGPSSPSRSVRAGALLATAGVLAACASAPPGEPAAPEGVRVGVVRHAEAYKNLDPQPADLSPSDLDHLTPRGKAQARRIAADLAQAELAPTRIIASPLGRTQETAEIIARELGLSDYFVDDRLSPLAGGATPAGEPATHAWRVRAWAAGEDPRPIGGESLAEGTTRALAAVRDHAADGGSPLVVVSHGDITAGLLGDAASTPPADRWARHELPTGGQEVVLLPLEGDPAGG